MFRVYVYLAIVAALAGSHGFMYWQGRQSVDVKNLKQSVEVMEKRNEIANNRPDTAVVIKRLRSGTF